MPVLIEEVEEEEAPPEPDLPEPEEEDPEPDEVVLSPESAEWVDQIVYRCMIFMEDFCERNLFPYQREVAQRIIESVIINDGEEITVLQARQSGKSEVLANTIATLMVLLPRLAKAFPEQLGKFKEGFWVGCFAPTEEQADTVWGRIVDRLTSEKAIEYMLDPELEDTVSKEGGKSKVVKLKISGSYCRRQTCNPKAKIESKSYHFILVDEAQDADDYTVRKSIHPMMAFYNGTIVKTGTPNRHKGDFHKAIRHNKRRMTRRGVRRNHFEYDYRFVCRYNENYKKFIAKEKARLGEDSDEFQLSYCCKWLLDQGMFVTEEALDALGDTGMRCYKSWWKSPVVVGVDPARTKDSTVVTVVWVDWDRPDAFGFYEHRVLNWLELTNKPWEQQYYEIAEFLSNYNILRIGVDTTGMGQPVFERLSVMFPNVEVVERPSDLKPQSERWRHLKSLIERQALVYPAHSQTKRLRCYKRFYQQMTDLETVFKGNHMLAAAPDEAEAHDDYPDSLAIACSLTEDDTMQMAEQYDSPFMTRRRR